MGQAGRISLSEVVPLALALALAACGPGGVGSSASGSAETTSSGSSSTTTDTSTSSSTTGAETDTETGDPPAFVVEPDISGGPHHCDPWLQDCPEGEKCVPYGSTGGNWDANKCVMIMGDRAPGEPCTYGGTFEATDDCDATGVCWDVEDVEGEFVGTCRQFCDGQPDDPSCPPGFYCPLHGDGSVTLCFPVCDVLAQDCDEGLGCYWSGSNFLCVFETENYPPGAPCGFLNDCAGSLLCVASEDLPACEGDSCCTPFCDLEQGDAGCAELPGTSCVPFFDGPAPAPNEQLGICMVAP